MLNKQILICTAFYHALLWNLTKRYTYNQEIYNRVQEY